MSPIFGDKKSLSQLQEDEQYVKQEVSVQQQKNLLKRLKEQGGDPKWFTIDEHGVKKLNVGAVIAWLGKPFRDE